MFSATKKFGTSLRRSSVPALALALVLFSAILWDGPARAGKRMALVIGNGDYRASNWTRLKNAVNDATDIAAALGRLDFAVTLLKNAGKAETVRSLGKFSKAAAGAELALIFYSGHSIEVDKRNFLIPVDASAEDPGSVAREAVPLERLLRAGGKAEGLRLILLDACRSSPFAGNIVPGKTVHAVGVGLGPPVDVSGEILVAYAAKAGTEASDGVGRNSPYTAALRYYLEKPGLEVGLLLRLVRDAVVAASQGSQQPFLYGSQSARLTYFRPPLELASPPARLTGPASVEESLDLTQRQRQRIQVALWAQGFYPGLPTGRFDGPTRKNIAEWQSNYGRDGTGFLDREAADSLLAEVADPSGPVWLKTVNQPCTVWIARPLPGAMAAGWTGDCVGGKASGRGRLLLNSIAGGLVFDGEMRDGMLTAAAIATVMSGPFKGERYEGEFRDGREHGRGVLTFADGKRRYEGEFREGKYHGHGVLIFANGTRRYEGEWREGKRHGRGILTIPNGIRYDGEWREGKMHGRGIMTYSASTGYEGEWREGKRHGRGIMIYPGGIRYDGEWRENKMHGRGIMTYSASTSYEGEWREGKRHGRGKMTFSNGSHYEGEFRHGEFHGSGTLTDGRSKYVGEFRDGNKDGRGVWTFPPYPRATLYKGEFLDDLPHGPGTIVFSDGMRYRGEFRQGGFHGKFVVTWSKGEHKGKRAEVDFSTLKKGRKDWFGRITWPDGRRYLGRSEDYDPHGSGTMTWSDGGIYKGSWSKGKPHGNGNYTGPGKQVYEGRWREGCLGVVGGKHIFLLTTAKACGFN